MIVPSLLVVAAAATAGRESPTTTNNDENSSSTTTAMVRRRRSASSSGTTTTLRAAATAAAATAATNTNNVNGLLEGLQRKLQQQEEEEQNQNGVAFPSSTLWMRPDSSGIFTTTNPDDDEDESTYTNNNALYELNKPPPTAFPTMSPTRPQGVDPTGRFCGMATRGTLVLHGGIFNYSNPLNDEMGWAMVDNLPMDETGRVSVPVVFLPGARQDVTERDRQDFVDQWSDVMGDGARFTVLHAESVGPDSTDIADAAEADTIEFAAPLEEAMGVFLPGGRQWRMIDAYKYTLTEELMWNVLDRGGVIAGTSAGAAVMASNMPRGDPVGGSSQVIAGREWYRHGMGFLRGVAIDNHIDSRQRELALYEFLNDGAENRKLLGIGLNEKTMIVVKGRYFQVRGDNPIESTVRLYDCSAIPNNVPCSYENAPFQSLSPGDWYDLCDRIGVSEPSDNELYGNTAVSRSIEYGIPYSFGDDYKAGNPSRFLCSGRICRWKSSRINVNNYGNDINTVRITGKVYMDDNESYSGFQPGDRLVLSYSVNDEEQIWRSVFNTAYDPLTSFAFSASSVGRDISATIPIPPRTYSIQLQIVAQTAVEGDAEYEVSNLKIERV